MATLRREWICPTIENTLTNPLHNTSTKPSSSGNSLYIHMGGGKPVQVIDFHQHSGDIFKITVSDGTSFIRATIYPRVSTEPTKGTVIGVKDYNLAFHTKSKQADQLYLDILDFSIVGEAAGVFGRPTDILKRKSVLQALKPLRVLFSSPKLDLQHSTSSRPVSPLGLSEESHPKRSSSLEIDINTQAMFATQTLNSVRDIRNTDIHQKTSTTNIPRKEDLLLALVKASKQPEVFQDINNVGEVPLRSPTPQKHTMLSQVSPDKAVRMAAKIQATANIQQSQTSLSSQPCSISNSQKLLSFTGDEKACAVTPIKAVYDSEKENNLENDRLAVVATNDAMAENLSQGNETSNERPTIQFLDPFLTENPFGGLKRVPRKYVRVPKAQQGLLNREDSWFQQVSSSRSAYATLPFDIREQLTTFISQIPYGFQQQDHIIEKENSRSGSCFNSGNDSGLESDEPAKITGRRSQYKPSRELSTSSSHHSSVPITAILNLANDDGSEEEDQASDVEPSQWPSSPADHKVHTLSTLKRALNTVNSSPKRTTSAVASDVVEDNHEELPGNINSKHDISGNIPQGEELESNSQISVISQVMPETNVYQRTIRVPVKFPSSSTVEEELEIDILYSEGDETEVCQCDRATVQVPETSQEIPSTAVQKSKLIQVEVTPLIDVCKNNQGRPNLTSPKVKPKHINRGYESTSSDSIIPATCIEVNLPEIPTLDSFTTDSDEFVEGDQNIPHLEQERMFDDDAEDMDEEASADYEDPPESRGPSIINEDIRSSPPILTSFPSHKVESWGRLDSEMELAAINIIASENPSSQNSPQLPKLVSLEDKLEERSSLLCQSSSPAKPSVKRDSVELMMHVEQNAAKKRRHISVAAAIKQEKYDERNTKEMARKHRHLFNNRHEVETSSPFGSSPPRQQPISKENLAANFETTRPLAKSSQPHQTQFRSSSRLDFYQKFMGKYPDFAGSCRDFTWALVYIEWLRQSQPLLHKSLFDDFIRAISSDYIPYVYKTHRAGRKAMTGWRFYDVKVEEPTYTLGVITPGNLQDALSTMDSNQVRQIRLQFNQPHETQQNQSQDRGIITSTQTRQYTISSSSESIARRRTLPWTKHSAPQTPNKQTTNFMSLLSSPVQGKTAYPERKAAALPSVSTQAVHGTLAEKRRIPASPILGQDPESIDTPLAKKARLEPRISESPKEVTFKAPSLSALREASSAGKACHHSAVDDTTKVKDWLNKPEKTSSWKAFLLKRKRLSGEFTSRASTPASSAGKRFCTMPKRPSMEQLNQIRNHGSIEME